MNITISAITFDCEHATNLARFWSDVLDRPLDPGPAESAEFFASIGRSDSSSGTPVLMFEQVPEGKTAKNRIHLDLHSADRDAAVARLVDLGATVLYDQDQSGVRWTTLADPSGNEFCVAEH